MKKRKNIEKMNLLTRIVFVLIALTFSLSINAQDAVWTKLMKGVNQDASVPSSALREKIMHEEGHMQTIAEAGFESVRFFIAASYSDLNNFEQRINDARKYNLTVIIAMWGKGTWESDPSAAKIELAAKWKEIATWVDQKFPGDDEFVFELLNETAAIGFGNGWGRPVSAENIAISNQFYGVAANAVREISTTRKILISPAGWQDAEYMETMTTTSLGYNYKNDPNCGVSIHFYKPNSQDVGWFAMNKEPLNNPDGDDWKQEIRKEVEFVQAWKSREGVTNMPVVITEWGCWMLEDREKRGDLAKFVDWTTQYLRDNNIASTWYTGIQNNQRAFGIFDSEFGWNNTVVKAITGQNAPASWPSTNQLVDTEFEDHYKMDADQRGYKSWHTIGGYSRVQFNQAISGKSSVVLNSGTKMFQRSYLGPSSSKSAEVGENIEPSDKRYLLHLVQNKTYHISFKAKGSGSLKISLKENTSQFKDGNIINSTGKTYFSDTQTVSNRASTYKFTYTHNVATAMDVMFEVEAVDGSITFDACDFRQFVEE